MQCAVTSVCPWARSIQKLLVVVSVAGKLLVVLFPHSGLKQRQHGPQSADSYPADTILPTWRRQFGCSGPTTGC